MAWWIQPLEISKAGLPTGKFRLTATSDEDGGGPYGLCEHEHDSTEEAYSCPDAQKKKECYG